jgi:hypothetical protein
MWLRAARRLPRCDWLALAAVSASLAGASLVLRLVPAAAVRVSRADLLPHDPWPVAGDALGEAARLWRLADAVARRAPRRPTCLAQALAVGWLLRRRGIATTLRFGVRRQEGVFAAHAWLECAGQAIGPARVTQGFTPLKRVDRPA